MSDQQRDYLCVFTDCDRTAWYLCEFCGAEYCAGHAAAAGGHCQCCSQRGVLRDSEGLTPAEFWYVLRLTPERAATPRQDEGGVRR